MYPDIRTVVWDINEPEFPFNFKPEVVIAIEVFEHVREERKRIDKDKTNIKKAQALLDSEQTTLTQDIAEMATKNAELSLAQEIWQERLKQEKKDWKGKLRKLDRRTEESAKESERLEVLRTELDARQQEFDTAEAALAESLSQVQMDRKLLDEVAIKVEKGREDLITMKRENIKIRATLEARSVHLDETRKELN